MKISIVAVCIYLLVVTTGCETTSRFGDETSGSGAIYEYKKTTAPDGTQTCTANSTSSREVDGATIKIDKDCAFEVSVEKADSPYEVMDRLMDFIELQTK